ncbi:hypothetical protein M011DRAFT_25245 [Sporormia fimetaria CBS 119925]|uniref:Uncharacterized protein n=1 Tax=Sporormia fimetaria CBS 119925 TaxID=1340428 RepID=A0A6A6VDV5_9PLEO|nr:hypothetical protein M011DRAFT_25245 [Sporormia fimetaria CBS 119925]
MMAHRPRSHDTNNGIIGADRAERTNFMFVDSGSHGTPAKPGKAVRSFVMRGARRSKTWSTKQKYKQSKELQNTSKHLGVPLLTDNEVSAASYTGADVGADWYPELNLLSR